LWNLTLHRMSKTRGFLYKLFIKLGGENLKNLKELYDELDSVRTILIRVLKSSEDLVGTEGRELRDKLAECEESIVDAMHEAVLLEVESTWKSRHKE